LNHKQIEAAAILIRIFFAGLAFNFYAVFHELEEVTRRALGAVESEVAGHRMVNLSCV
jgi:hypothetical protein